MVSRGVLGLLLLLALQPAAGQGRDWPVEDRTILGDFTRVTAVAVTIDRVYAVTPTALLGYEPTTRRWHGPWQPPRTDGLTRVFSALADPLDNALWLVTPEGWLRFDPFINLWEAGTVPGRVSDAALDQDNPAGGLFLRTASGWYSAGRGGVAMPSAAPRRPLRPASVEEAIRANPAIQATTAILVGSSRRGDVRYLAAARARGFTGLGWYLGTSGAGLLFFPDAAGRPELLPFGLPAARADALFAGGDGVWVVTERTPLVDPALSFVGREFGEVRWYQGPRATGFPFGEARRVVGRGPALWLATDVGAIRYLPREDEATRFDAGRGLPDSRVLDLAQRQGRLVAATARGLAEFSDSLGFAPLAPGFTSAAYALALSGDTTWVGTSLGLFAALPGEADLREPEALREMPSAHRPVVDITWRGDTLVALNEERLLWRDPGTGRYTLGPLLGAGLGRLHTVVNGKRGLFVAGDRGVGAAQLATPVVRPLTTPLDLPGPVTDLAVDEDYLWVTTLAGLVRFRLEAVR